MVSGVRTGKIVRDWQERRQARRTIDDRAAKRICVSTTGPYLEYKRRLQVLLGHFKSLAGPAVEKASKTIDEMNWDKFNEEFSLGPLMSDKTNMDCLRRIFHNMPLDPPSPARVDALIAYFKFVDGELGAMAAKCRAIVIDDSDFAQMFATLAQKVEAYEGDKQVRCNKRSHDNI